MCPQKHVIQCAGLVTIVTYVLAQLAIWVGHTWFRG